METKNNGRLILVIALVIAVIGLSVGFAAFSTRLTVSTAANVTTGSQNWNVGFSTNGTSIANVDSATEKPANGSNPGKLNVTKYTIGQKTNATLTTTEGSSVSYSLSILNKGSIAAYLDSVTFAQDPITCTNASAGSSTLIEGSAEAGSSTTGGNTTTISPTDCAKMFSVTLSIGGTDFTPTNHSGSSTISAGGNAAVVLTIAYTGTDDADEIAATLDGDIIVNVGTITVIYTSNNPSGN